MQWLSYLSDSIIFKIIKINCFDMICIYCGYPGQKSVRESGQRLPHIHSHQGVVWLILHENLWIHTLDHPLSPCGPIRSKPWHCIELDRGLGHHPVTSAKISSKQKECSCLSFTLPSILSKNSLMSLTFPALPSQDPFVHPRGKRLSKKDLGSSHEQPRGRPFLVCFGSIALSGVHGMGIGLKSRF